MPPLPIIFWFVDRALLQYLVPGINKNVLIFKLKNKLEFINFFLDKDGSNDQYYEAKRV